MSCSLPVINNEPCHRKIKGGECPGFAEGMCTNEAGIRLLRRRHENVVLEAWHFERAERREAKGCFPSHFVDQSDRVTPNVEKIVGATLTCLALCIKRATHTQSRRVQKAS